jgi:Big-like domain-containing protein
MKDHRANRRDGRALRASVALAVFVVTFASGNGQSAAQSPAGPDGLEPCVSATYDDAGSVECVVPAGVPSIGVVATGGQGGSTGDRVTGGLGGVARGVINVTPGEVLTIFVGGSGGGHGGVGGAHGGDHGTAAYFSSFTGGGGGGSSEVRNAAGVRLVVAGGGGGAGGGSNVPAGGGAGGQGGVGGVYFGANGTFAAPGANASGYKDNGGKGGCGSCVDGDGTSGGSSSRGDGGGGGGGGGGGYRSGAGGGGGDFAGGGGGGGGGLSYIEPSATNVSFDTATKAGDGSVKLVLSPDTTGLPTGPAATPVTTGDPITFSDPGTATWPVPPDVVAIVITAVGGAGGAEDGTGGLGDRVTATVKVTPGSTLDLIIGASGGETGGTGYGKGGDHGSTCGDVCTGHDGFGGGGATSVSYAGQPLVVAGGGGGGGGNSKTDGDGADGGHGGISPQPGYYSIDANQFANYAVGGGGGSNSSTSGGKGGGCEDFSNGASGGGGGGFLLPTMGGGGEGGSDCSEPGTGDGDVGGSGSGGGAGGGGGRSYVEPRARAVSFGGTSSDGNGFITITPATGGVLTVDSDSNSWAYPGQFFNNNIGITATDIFGDGIPGLAVTFKAPPKSATFSDSSSDCVDDGAECIITTDAGGYISIYATAQVPPYDPAPFSVAISAPGFETVEVTGLVIRLIPTLTSVTPSTPTNESVSGEAVAFTATITTPQVIGSFTPPTGNVEFTVDGNLVPGGPWPLDPDGTATIPPITNLALGPHTVEASYAGDDAHQLFAPGSGSMTQTVRSSGVTVDVSSSANPAAHGADVTFTAIVAPLPTSAGTPTGTVQFSVDGKDHGQPIVLSPDAPFEVHSAPLQLSSGSHPVVATYSGDKTFASNTGILDQSMKYPTNLGLKSCFLVHDQEPDCTDSVQGMVLVAQIQAEETVPDPSGTVQFFVNGQPFGNPAPLVTGPDIGFDGFVAISKPLNQSIGPATFGAHYSGDEARNKATANARGPLYGARSIVQLSSSIPIILPVSPWTTFTIKVNDAAGTAHSAGTVQLWNTNTNKSLGGKLNLVNQVATLPDQGSCEIGTGQIGIRADYSGDPGYELAPGTDSIVQIVLSVCLDDSVE